VQEAAGSTSDSGTSALSGLCFSRQRGHDNALCHPVYVEFLTLRNMTGHQRVRCLDALMCVVVPAEAAKSSADAVSDKASDLLGGVPDGVSAARDTAQQLLDSANSATGDLQATASDIQGSVSLSLSSAFDILHTSTSLAIGASGSRALLPSLHSRGSQPDPNILREQVHCRSLCTRYCQWSVMRPCRRHSKQQTVPCSSDSHNDMRLATFAHSAERGQIADP